MCHFVFIYKAQIYVAKMCTFAFAEKKRTNKRKIKSFATLRTGKTSPLATSQLFLEL